MRSHSSVRQNMGTAAKVSACETVQNISKNKSMAPDTAARAKTVGVNVPNGCNHTAYCLPVQSVLAVLFFFFLNPYLIFKLSITATEVYPGRVLQSFLHSDITIKSSQSPNPPLSANNPFRPSSPPKRQPSCL